MLREKSERWCFDVNIGINNSLKIIVISLIVGIYIGRHGREAPYYKNHKPISRK